MSYYDITKPYNQYCENVLTGKILTNKYIKLACERYKSWFNRDDMYPDYEDVDRKIRFIKKMKHVTGDFEGKPFELLDFQSWIMAGIFLFKWTKNNKRVIKNALLFIARKNGKTSLSAAITIAHLLCDNEPNAEVACLANSRDQSKILFTAISNYCETLDPKQKIFQRYRHSLNVPLTKGHVNVYSADASTLDGHNLSCGIVDEFGMAKTWDLYNVMKSSMGMRSQPLMITITTANFLVGEYPLYEMWQNCKEILIGTKHDDTQFAALYQLDENDDWKDESNWPKASPTLGNVVGWDFMRDEFQIAVNSPSLEVNFKTKLLNQFCESAVTWIPREQILKCTEKLTFDMFKPTRDEEYFCYVGVDLASVNDLTAVSYMVEKDGLLYFKTDYYIPTGSIDGNKNKELYRKWIKDGYLKVMHGERANYDEVVADLIKFNEKIPILQVLYDKYNASSFKQKCEEQGWVMTSFSQTLGAFNNPTKEFERNIFLNKIIIDDNPITRWCFSNVELKFDEKENCKPMKSNGGSNKIDGVIAILMTYGGWLNATNNYSTITVI